MPNGQLVQWLGTLGMGGVLAALMFLLYRKDMQAHQEAWKGVTERVVTAMLENTAAVTRLAALLDQRRREGE